MTTKQFASIWDTIEDRPTEAEAMKLRSSLMMALTDHIAREKLTQKAVPRFSA